MQYQFEGNSDRRSKKPHPDSPTTREPYLASPELKKAVNLAIYLKRPLLLEGEAGCGKTRLARAVAYELGLPLYRWDIRSTTKAVDGLYKYDAISRLHDVQILERTQQLPKQTNRNPQTPEDYIAFGALGKAFKADRPAVVLIDEIDKADLDFPNDLLGVLDEPWRFEIPETGEVGDRAIQAKYPPIVIVTSNKEKGNLPAPFLRRCLYHYVAFPKKESLQEIVKLHYAHPSPDSPSELPDETWIDRAIELFLQVRQQGLLKLPGTSEFLDWFRALAHFENQPFSADELTIDALPYRELLLKLRQDWQKVFS